jgi:hypothetical protein
MKNSSIVAGGPRSKMLGTSEGGRVEAAAAAVAAPDGI